MLPVPPSCDKGTPSWSSLKRKSWLYPNSLNCARENVYESHLLKTKKAAEQEPMLLPNRIPHSCVPPVRILTMKTLGTTEYQFPLILYNNKMLKENFISPVSKLLHLPENNKVRKKLTSIQNIHLLKLPANCSIVPWENNDHNLNKLLSLDEIKSLTKFNPKTMKKVKQHSINLHLLKSHFLLNEQESSNKSNGYHQLLKLNQNNSNIKYQLSSNGKLLRLPYLCHPIERKFNHNKTDNKISNNNVTSKETYLSNYKGTKDYKPTSNEQTLQMLTYPIHSEQHNNVDQHTLSDISWALETTKENIKPNSVNNLKDYNVSQCKFDPSIQNDKKFYNDCGVQFNFVDYGEPKTQIGFNTFTNCENAAWPSDCIEQLLSNDVAHVTKQFLSIHTSDLIDWNNEDKCIVPCVPLHINTSNIYEQNPCNSPVNKQPIEMNNTISPSKIVHNESSLVSKSQINNVTTTTTITNISTENKPELFITDLVTAKMLQNSNKVNQDNKQSMNNEVKSLLSCNKQGSSYFPLDVVKALSEIDNRLNVIDKVSVQLEQDHKRNQELLETIIQLNKEQSQVNLSCQLDEPNKSETTSKQQKLQLPDELNFNGDQVHNEKIIDSEINPNVQDQRHDCTIVKQQIKSPKPIERSHSITGHYTDEREKLRKERREASMTRRCNEAKQFVNEILSDSILPKQSSPRLDQSIIPKHSNTPIKRGRSLTHSRGTSRVLNQRNLLNNYITPSSPKPPTPVRFHYNARSGFTARGARNISGNRGQQTKIVQKQSVVSHSHPDTPKHLTYEDDLQTTILSDWSLESNVKRILYGDEEDRFCSPSRQQSGSRISNFDQESQIPQSPHSMPETDLLTEIGGVPSTSFIDWDEIDELIGDL
ncbi:unnamed protein product [Schistosoma rodhaini]|uniref:Uncharacterized protein n=1 Tax=Schistosoma rodhaini TaxID=6188 RepID=A0AA85EKH7_9TREM|nr:unnamed protein product [Schistosoma rodhaini]